MIRQLNQSVFLAAAVAAGCLAGVARAEYTRGFPAMKEVTVTGGFWAPRLETNRVVTVWTDFKRCEETDRIANFENAGKVNAGDKTKLGTFKGIPFNDSDVFKVIEGACYTLATHPDEKLDKYLDDLIAKIASAQERDGYLYTARTLGRVDPWTGLTRWSNLKTNHELYNVGHLYEAAAAHYEVTGKRALLDVALRNADLIARTFGTGEWKIRDVSGHEEIETGLCSLYRVTKDTKYLDLARELTDMRGRKDLRRVYGPYCQDHQPATNQTEAVGHAVRATYLYCAMADLAAYTGERAYADACARLWEDAASKKTYLTGGIGSLKKGEAFGAAYELPNATAYNETCAAIGYALWNVRMWRLTGDAKHIDMLERILYNGMLSGWGIGGDEFFYPNPLASDGTYARSKWFGCSCCPVNIVRFVPQIPTWAFGTGDGGLYWNLFVSCRAALKVTGTCGSARVTDTCAGGGGAKVTGTCGERKVTGTCVVVEQRTEYPFDGRAVLKVSPEKPVTFPLRVRVPGWARGAAYPGGLYADVKTQDAGALKIAVNGVEVNAETADGYVCVTREWKDGDTVTLSLPLAVRRVKAHDAVAADRGRLAVMRGPLVYCAEGADNDGKVLERPLPADTVFAEERLTIAGVELPALAGGGLKLIPYFAWCHRGKNEMQVWFPTEATPAAADGAR